MSKVFQLRDQPLRSEGGTNGDVKQRAFVVPDNQIGSRALNTFKATSYFHGVILAVMDKLNFFTRLNNTTPSLCSSLIICLLTALCVRCNSSAARVQFSCRATHSNISSAARLGMIFRMVYRPSNLVARQLRQGKPYPIFGADLY